MCMCCSVHLSAFRNIGFIPNTLCGLTMLGSITNQVEFVVSTQDNDMRFYICQFGLTSSFRRFQHAFFFLYAFSFTIKYINAEWKISGVYQPSKKRYEIWTTWPNWSAVVRSIQAFSGAFVHVQAVPNLFCPKVFFRRRINEIHFILLWLVCILSKNTIFFERNFSTRATT